MDLSREERPYVLFVYKQKVQVEGHGVYEFKSTNLINPYTLKATPMQPSLINPAHMLTQEYKASKHKKTSSNAS